MKCPLFGNEIVSFSRR